MTGTVCLHTGAPIATLGGDVAGVVASVGPDETDLAVGDRVFGNAYTLIGGSGAFAEQAVVQAGALARIPEQLTFEQAAAMPVAGSTAVEAIMRGLALQRGQAIFISGGSGAVGSAAVQLAKHLGARVVTTASGEGVALAESLGADEVIDYTTTDFSDLVDGVDAVFDTVGGDTLERAYGIVKPGGTIVTVVGDLDQARLENAGIRGVRQSTQSDGVLRELADHLEAGVVTSRVGATFALDDIAAAYVALEGRTVRGKVVVIP